jgi:N-acetylglutamate synthase
MNDNWIICMNITYRLLQESDYDQIIETWNESGLPIRPRGRDSREEICNQINNDPDFFIGAFSDDRLIGLVVASSDGRKGWINRLAVIPDFREKGIARKLIGLAEEVLQKTGIKIISCLIENENLASLKLFQSMDYESTADVIYLRKPLNDDI